VTTTICRGRVEAVRLHLVLSPSKARGEITPEECQRRRELIRSS